MKSVNALKLRQSLGAVLRQLEKGGAPILVERNAKPVGVLISISEYQKRFVDKEADDKRKQIVERILQAQLSLPKGEDSLDLIKAARR